MKTASAHLKRLLLVSFAAINGRLAAAAAWVATRTFNHSHLLSQEPIQEVRPESKPQSIPEPVRKETHDMETQTVWPRDRIEYMVRLMAKGTSIGDTAQQLGVSVDEVNGALKTLPDNLAGATRRSDWPGYKVAVLLIGLSERRKFSEIARDVGHTDEAVSSKARRLRRLGQLRGPKGQETAVGGPPAVVPAPKRGRGPSSPKRMDRRPPFGERSILDMTFNSCRWPTGRNCSGQHVFCGRRREDGYSFCAVHTLRAHTFSLGGESERARVERAASSADYT